MSNALLDYSSWSFQLIAALAILYLVVGLIRPAWDSCERYRPVLLSARGELQDRHEDLDRRDARLLVEELGCDSLAWFALRRDKDVTWITNGAFRPPASGGLAATPYKSRTGGRK